MSRGGGDGGMEGREGASGKMNSNISNSIVIVYLYSTLIKGRFLSEDTEE